MNADRVTTPSRTVVRHVPGQRHPEQRAEIAAFEAWQRLHWTGVEPAGPARQGKVIKQSKAWRPARGSGQPLEARGK